jgi:hypothetical protein
MSFGGNTELEGAIVIFLGWDVEEEGSRMIYNYGP